MKRLTSLLSTALLTTLGSLHVQAAPALGIAPLKLQLSARDKATSLILTNTGDRPITLSVEVRHWTQVGGQDTLEPTDHVIAAPGQVTLNPGGRQVVRLARLNLPTGSEDTYRVLVTEVPGAANGEPAGLRTVLQLSVPLFEGVMQGQPQLEAGYTGGQLVLRNTGDLHVRLAQLEFRDAAGWHPLQGLAYVLPGQFRSYPVPGALELRYQHDESLATVVLPVR